MAYELLNDKLRLWSCGVSDLTIKQFSVILEQWGEENSAGTISLFYDPVQRRIVLNKDNSDYDIYLTLCTEYLGADPTKRGRLANRLRTTDLQEAINVLEYAVNDMEAYKNLFILNHQPGLTDDYELSYQMSMLIKQNYADQSIYLGLCKAFEFGVMQGKRMERAKKKVGLS